MHSYIFIKRQYWIYEHHQANNTHKTLKEKNNPQGDNNLLKENTTHNLHKLYTTSVGKTPASLQNEHVFTSTQMAYLWPLHEYAQSVKIFCQSMMKWETNYMHLRIKTSTMNYMLVAICNHHKTLTPPLTTKTTACTQDTIHSPRIVQKSAPKLHHGALLLTFNLTPKLRLDCCRDHLVLRKFSQLKV